MVQSKQQCFIGSMLCRRSSAASGRFSSTVSLRRREIVTGSLQILFSEVQAADFSHMSSR